VAEPDWLTVHGVVERLRAAGYRDSAMTVRRMVDDGEFGSQGKDWYRTERGKYRMVSAAAVQALVARRRDQGTQS
jgi:molybdopterin-guanine dinucleotide biosynthesis protein